MGIEMFNIIGKMKKRSENKMSPHVSNDKEILKETPKPKTADYSKEHRERRLRNINRVDKLRLISNPLSGEECVYSYGKLYTIGYGERMKEITDLSMEQVQLLSNIVNSDFKNRASRFAYGDSLPDFAKERMTARDYQVFMIFGTPLGDLHIFDENKNLWIVTDSEVSYTECPTEWEEALTEEWDKTQDILQDRYQSVIKGLRKQDSFNRPEIRWDDWKRNLFLRVHGHVYQVRIKGIISYKGVISGGHWQHLEGESNETI